MNGKSDKTKIKSMTFEELEAFCESLGEKKFRAKQVFEWMHKGVRSFEEMTNLPKAFREKLTESAELEALETETLQVSKKDGTRKYLFRLPDGQFVESVLTKYSYGNTVCISTQAGCRMGCAFCASTLQGCVRNLSAGEMLGEILCANRFLAESGEAGTRVHNVVLMGSGEPLDNYDETVRFLRLLREPEGVNLSLRGVSLSTCGLVDRMRAFTEEGLPVTLSVSLHAPNDTIRRRLMPVANRWPIGEVLAASRHWVEKTGRRVIFEYALVDGVNADPAQAVELASRLRGFQCHVNLIPLNDVPERGLRGVTEAQVRRFLETLTEHHISATRRREMGDDIEGACGQLRRSEITRNGV